MRKVVPKFKLVRSGQSHYSTKDGIFTIWQSRSGYGCEVMWNVSHIHFDEGIHPEGFKTKWEAVEWLKRQYELMEDWLFKDFHILIE